MGAEIPSRPDRRKPESGNAGMAVGGTYISTERWGKHSILEKTSRRRIISASKEGSHALDCHHEPEGWCRKNDHRSEHQRCAGRTGLRICLIDLDPQAHATLHLGIEPLAHEPSIYDVLTGKTRLSEVRRQVAENLWVVGSTLDLAAADLELAGVVGREMILRDKLNSEPQPFDYLLVDCPPSLGVLTLNALVAVDEVFIPLQTAFPRLARPEQAVGKRSIWWPCG